MPSSVVQSFTDPDAYGAAIRAARVDIKIVERGDFTAHLTRIDLDHLWMQRMSESLPRIKHAACEPTRSIISFVTSPGSGMITNSVPIPVGTIVRHSAGHNYHQRSSDASSLASMSLPVEEMASVGSEVAGCDLTPPIDALLVRPSPSAMAKLQRLHAAIVQLAETAPEIISLPETAHGLEQALVEAMVQCLSARDTGEDSSACRRHSRIMRRFHAMIEESLERALYVPEICRTIGVSERTLRSCCQEQLGMSPKFYLLKRRMHIARRDLRNAVPTATTVTEVAARYGFWHFGRFAREYRQLFDELPSSTLGRPPP